MPIFRLKQHVTEDNLKSVGFEIHKANMVWHYHCATKELANGKELYIPLEPSPWGNCVVQYGVADSEPSEMLAEDIEDLIEKDWVEEVQDNA